MSWHVYTRAPGGEFWTIVTSDVSDPDALCWGGVHTLTLDTQREARGVADLFEQRDGAEAVAVTSGVASKRLVIGSHGALDVMYRLERRLRKGETR